MKKKTNKKLDKQNLAVEVNYAQLFNQLAMQIFKCFYFLTKTDRTHFS